MSFFVIGAADAGQTAFMPADLYLMPQPAQALGKRAELKVAAPGAADHAALAQVDRPLFGGNGQEPYLDYP